MLRAALAELRRARSATRSALQSRSAACTAASARAAKPDALEARPLAVGKSLALHDASTRRGRRRGAHPIEELRSADLGARIGGLVLVVEHELVVDERRVERDRGGRPHAGERHRQARHRGDIALPFALSPVLRERDVRMSDRGCPATRAGLRSSRPHGHGDPAARTRSWSFCRISRTSWTSAFTVAAKPSKPSAFHAARTWRRRAPRRRRARRRIRRRLHR